MKKMFFGNMLFFAGIIIAMILFVLSIIHPWSYNNIDGFIGFLLGSNTFILFIVCIITSFIGFRICFKEAYSEDKDS